MIVVGTTSVVALVENIGTVEPVGVHSFEHCTFVGQELIVSLFCLIDE